MGFPNVAVAVGLMLMLVVIDHPAVVEGTVDCKQVRTSLTDCVDYVKHGTSPPPASCCNGVRSVKNSARSRADRQQACECLKGLARLVRNINYNNYVAALPGKCGVTIQFPIKPSTNCKRVT